MMAAVIQRAGDQLGDFLPRLAGALILLVIGLLAAIVLGRITRRLLVRGGLDRFPSAPAPASCWPRPGSGRRSRRSWGPRCGSRSS